MDIFFTDSSEAPLPPDEVRIRSLQAEPYPDGRRVRVTLEVDPFQRRPSADLAILDRDGVEVAGVSVIESMARKMEMTMHLRNTAPGEFSLLAVVYYSTIEEPGDAPASDRPLQRSEVDTATVKFSTAGA